jgi:hypothetical protein
MIVGTLRTGGLHTHIVYHSNRVTFIVQTMEPLSIWARVRSTSLNIASLLWASLYKVFQSKPVSQIRCSMAYRAWLAWLTLAMHAVSNSDSEGSRDDQGKPSGERCNG